MKNLIAINCYNKTLIRFSKYLKRSQRRFDKPIRFDGFLSIDQLRIRPLAQALQPQLDQGRKRQRKAAEAARFEQRLTTVVANALVADDQARPCRYSRRKSTYSGPSRFYPAYIRSEALVELVDQMEVAGYLEHTKANPGTHEERQSTFRATPLLKRELSLIGISIDQVRGLAEAAPVIEFRNDRKERLENEEFLAFLKPQAGLIRQHYAQLATHEFTLGAGRKPMRLLTPMRRIFNNGSLEQGGRFYGGWWQNVRSKLRSTIEIDGQETVELDYSGFMPRALYHSLGIDYAEDPYDLPDVYAAAEAEGFSRKKARDGIKRIFLVLLNGRDERMEPSSVSLPAGISRSDVFDLLREKHKALSSFFHSGITVNLMKNESDICEAILRDGIKDGVPVLPIHDSYIVPLASKSWLLDKMKNHYFIMFGYNPIIK